MNLSFLNKPLTLSSIRGYGAGLFAFVLLGGFSLAADTPGRAFLIDGRVVPGWIQRVEENGVVWKTASGQVGTFPMDRVREIRLKLPDDFRNAQQQLSNQSDPEAIRILEAYANTSNPDSYYPVPGNLASEAVRVLFLHYRSEGRAEQAAVWADRYNPGLLPRVEKPPLLNLYRRFTSPPDDSFFETARSLQENAEEPLRLEIQYLLGVAYEMHEENDQALLAYARVYSPAGGVSNPYGEKAIDRSHRLLEDSASALGADRESLLHSLETIRHLLYGTP
jgi:hypothetical protein